MAPYAPVRRARGDLDGRPADRPRPHPTIARCHDFDITEGKFSFEGKSTLRSTSNSVIRIKVTGRFGDNKITGKITYLDAPAPCTTRSYSAKYYGVNPQG